MFPYKFFFLPNSDLIEAVANLLSKRSDRMVGLLNTVARNGLKIASVGALLNCYTTVKALDQLLVSVKGGMDVTAAIDYLAWFRSHGFLTIPDAYFLLPSPALSITSTPPYKDEGRHFQSAIHYVKSATEWRSRVVRKVLIITRCIPSVAEQRKFLQWFSERGYPLTSMSVRRYLDAGRSEVVWSHRPWKGELVEERLQSYIREK
ncbi:hypothetical protein HDV00_004348 [Rhizophlyctis rosea]|nr:hypothetical protein HDV00_004348 [Rhizophlyctis rosea]